MNPSKRSIVTLSAEHDQDTTELMSWLVKADNAFKKSVWDRIQVPHDDPVDEAVTRLAQWAFTEAILRQMQETTQEHSQ